MATKVSRCTVRWHPYNCRHNLLGFVTLIWRLPADRPSLWQAFTVNTFSPSWRLVHATEYREVPAWRRNKEKEKEGKRSKGNCHSSTGSGLKIMHVENELTVKLWPIIQRTLVDQFSSTSRLPCEHHIISNKFSCSSRCVAIHTQCWLFEHWAMWQYVWTNLFHCV